MSNTVEYDKNIQPETIYLDYAATTPTDLSVLSAMLPYFDKSYSNPSSMHSSGRRAAQVIAKARANVAHVIGALPEEIIFTGSGTESDNMALFGVARAYKKLGNHIIISAIEHKAVTEAAKRLEKEGFEVSIAPVRSDGIVDVEACLKLVTDRTILVSIMLANNEIGTIQPIIYLSRAIHDHKEKQKGQSGGNALPFFHTDACQAAGFLSLDVKELGVDLMTLNGSKIYGPKGVGVLFKKKNIRTEPILVGGEQEFNIRAGTESLPLIVGFAEALKMTDGMREKESLRLFELRDYFTEGLLKKIPGAILNGNRSLRLPNNVHISIPHIEGESILLMLDKLGIEASTGSACSAYDLKPSHVLLAIGQTAEFAHGSVRFSLGRSTTKRQLDHVLEVFPPIATRLSIISALTTHKVKSK